MANHRSLVFAISQGVSSFQVCKGLRRQFLIDCLVVVRFYEFLIDMIFLSDPRFSLGSPVLHACVLVVTLQKGIDLKL